MSSQVVDVHSHLYPQAYMRMLKARMQPPQIVGDDGEERFVIFPGEHGRPMGDEYWSIGAKLAFMERHGIDRTVLSLGNPWLDPFDGPDAPDLARAVHAEMASLEDDTAGRIVGMGVLPQNDVSSAAAMVGEIADTPTLHGIISGTRLCGLTLDDEALDPIWEHLESTGTPLLIHPHYTSAGNELDGFGHAFPVALGFTFETTIAIARLVFGGVYRRFPELRVVASHGGGTIPYLAGRLDAAWQSDPSVQERLPVVPSEDLQRLYTDAVVYHPRALRALTDLVGADRIAFGTDHPFSVADPAATLEAVRSGTPTRPEREQILEGVAIELFGIPR